MAKREDTYVFVGKKDTMAYVLAAIMQINTESREVIIKARGMAISRAVDVAEILRNKFCPNARIKDIKIYTEVLTSEGRGTSNVSSIEIVMIREDTPSTAPPEKKQAAAPAPLKPM
jgi:DNA-binding protein